MALCAGFLLFSAPNFQTTLLFMTYLTACHTPYDIFFFAIACFVAKFIALETKLFCAFKRIVGVFSAKNTIESRSIIWTLSCHVTEFSTSKTFYCYVLFQKVSAHLILHFSEHVIYLCSFLLNLFLVFFTLRTFVFRIISDMLSYVHITSYRTFRGN